MPHSIQKAKLAQADDNLIDFIWRFSSMKESIGKSFVIKAAIFNYMLAQRYFIFFYERIFWQVLCYYQGSHMRLHTHSGTLFQMSVAFEHTFRTLYDLESIAQTRRYRHVYSLAFL